jgi:YVTN family beta-propeller protein
MTAMSAAYRFAATAAAAVARATAGRRGLKGGPALLAIIMFTACGGEAPKNTASQPAATSTVPAPKPAVRVFVTNEASGDLSVIDAATQMVIATAPLGKRPRGIKPSPDGTSLYVALSGSPNAGPGVDPKTLPPPDRSADGIGEVDTDTYKVKRIIHAGADPEQLDVSADGSRLYVANEDTAQVSVVDTASGTIVATVKIGEEPEGVTIRPDGKVVYVTSEEDGAVFAIDTATNKVLNRIPVGHRPRSIGFLPDGSRAYVSLENDGALALVDAQRHRFIKLVPLEGQGNTPKTRPMGITVRPDGTAVYVTTGSFGNLFILDPKTNAGNESLAVGQRPWGVGLLPDGKTVYTANGPSNDVSVVDLAAKQVVKKIPVGQRPWGIAVVVSR